MPRPSIKPRCYNCRERRTPPGSYFCSDRCARIYAEEIVGGADERWCGHCRDWALRDRYGDDPEGCPTCRGPLVDPMAALTNRGA